MSDSQLWLLPASPVVDPMRTKRSPLERLGSAAPEVKPILTVKTRRIEPLLAGEWVALSWPAKGPQQAKRITHDH